MAARELEMGSRLFSTCFTPYFSMSAPTPPFIERACPYLDGSFNARVCTVDTAGEQVVLHCVPVTAGGRSERFSLDEPVSEGGQGRVYRGTALGKCMHVLLA